MTGRTRPRSGDGRRRGGRGLDGPLHRIRSGGTVAARRGAAAVQGTTALAAARLRRLSRRGGRGAAGLRPGHHRRDARLRHRPDLCDAVLPAGLLHRLGHRRQPGGEPSAQERRRGRGGEGTDAAGLGPGGRGAGRPRRIRPAPGRPVRLRDGAAPRRHRPVRRVRGHRLRHERPRPPGPGPRRRPLGPAAVRRVRPVHRLRPAAGPGPLRRNVRLRHRRTELRRLLRPVHRHHQPGPLLRLRRLRRRLRQPGRAAELRRPLRPELRPGHVRHGGVRHGHPARRRLGPPAARRRAVPPMPPEQPTAYGNGYDTGQNEQYRY